MWREITRVRPMPGRLRRRRIVYVPPGSPGLAFLNGWRFASFAIITSFYLEVRHLAVILVLARNKFDVLFLSF